MTTNDSAVLAWHFVGATLRDGRPVPADGELLVHDGPVVWCRSGLYASLDPFDALQYALSTNLCRVECADLIHCEDDKLVCRRRRIIKRRDATEMLLAFARWSALQVTHLWDAPLVVKRFLETGDDSLRAAASAAVSAAESDAASDAVSAAARAAARAAASAAARAAAWDAASDAVRAAASAAAWDAASAAASAAAWDAASAAARAAAWDAQRAEFNHRVRELFQ